MSTTGNKIFFDTLGCAKNHCDTEAMEKKLNAAGYNSTENLEEADLIILNTCAFIEAASQESINTFFEYNSIGKPIIVVGCLVSRYKRDLEESLTEAKIFVSCKDEDNIVDYVNKVLKPQNKITKEQAFTPYKYVKISDGCNRFCSYCTIPFIRGRYKSDKYEDIENRVREANAKEIVFVAQDTASYHDGDCDLSMLLNRISKTFPEKFFRVLYIQPDGINADLLDTIKNNDNIASYLDIPLQHVNTGLLKTMNRKAIPDLSYIKRTIPEVALRTTLIVGYPGETDEDFEELCNYMKDSEFDYVGIFKYSKEEGTKAAKLPNQVPEELKEQRYNILRDICDANSFSRLEDKIGTTQLVLLEGYEDGRYFGRSQFQAPDVDGVVYVQGQNLEIGNVVSVKITDTELYDLVGELSEK